ncbi:hypothetical protein JFU58_10085 [Pseudomonas sp. TH34]|nr:hypothetical protein [Pseudomonas sp. TH34]
MDTASLVDVEPLGYQSTVNFKYSPAPSTEYLQIDGRYTVRGFDGNTTLAGPGGWTWRNEVAMATLCVWGAGLHGRRYRPNIAHRKPGTTWKNAHRQRDRTAGQCQYFWLRHRARGGIEKAEVFADPKVIMDRIEQARIKGFAMR